MTFIDQLITLLKSQNKPNSSNLPDLIQQLPLSLEQIKPYILEPIPPLTYGRNTIYLSEDYEVVIVHLPPFSSTSIHNHGASIGCAFVVEGTLVNQLFTLDPITEGVIRTQIIEVNKGEFFYAERGNIHSMHNFTDESLITLHVYTPRLTGHQLYPNPE